MAPFRNLKLNASVAINHTGGGKVERNGATLLVHLRKELAHTNYHKIQ